MDGTVTCIISRPEYLRLTEQALSGTVNQILSDLVLSYLLWTTGRVTLIVGDETDRSNQSKLYRPESD